MGTFRMARTVHAPQERAWEVVSDLEHFAEYATTIAGSRVVNGEGEGLIRQCWDNDGNRWNEACTLWDEGKEYTFEVDMAGHPAEKQVREMRGNFSVEAIDPSTSRICLRFDYKLKSGLIGKVLAPIIKLQARPSAKIMLDNWQAKIEGSSEASSGRARTAPVDVR